MVETSTVKSLVRREARTGLTDSKKLIGSVDCRSRESEKILESGV